MRDALLVLALILAATATAGYPASGGGEPEAPVRIIAYGDSFTRGYLPVHGDNPDLSWATGGDPAVASVASRLGAPSPSIEAENAALSGARLTDLAGLVAAHTAGAALVLVWLGTNDVCGVPPTPDDRFLDAAQEGFDALDRAHPDALVFVLMIPDMARLGALARDDPHAEALRSQGQYCHALWHPEREEHARERDRLDRFNGVLRAQALLRGYHASDATWWPGLESEDLSPVDHLHLERTGQARVAQAVWADLAPRVA